jgi:hypothetical protein
MTTVQNDPRTLDLLQHHLSEEVERLRKERDWIGKIGGWLFEWQSKGELTLPKIDQAIKDLQIARMSVYEHEQNAAVYDALARTVRQTSPIEVEARRAVSQPLTPVVDPLGLPRLRSLLGSVVRIQAVDGDTVGTLAKVITEGGAVDGAARVVIDQGASVLNIHLRDVTAIEEHEPAPDRTNPDAPEPDRTGPDEAGRGTGGQLVATKSTVDSETRPVPAKAKTKDGGDS